MAFHHVVEFYGADRDALVQHIGRYAAEGLQAGEAVIIIANRGLHDAIFAIVDRLRAEDEPDTGGRLCVLDSEKMLGELYAGGRLSADRFDEVVGGLLRGIILQSHSYRMRVFGDMVGILWQRGNRRDAIELERYWNDFQARLPFDLYCGYRVDASDKEQAAAISPIVSEHSEVVHTKQYARSS